MKIKWYFFILTIIVLSIITFPFISNKDQKALKIGIIMIGDSRYEKLIGLKKGMNELGYDDWSTEFLVKSGRDQEAALASKIEELLNEKPALIVALGGIEALKLKEIMEKQNIQIPVVFAGVAAPKEIGLIKDYRSPGGLFTGINNYHTSLSGKRLEIFRDLVPSISRFHILFDEDIEVSKLSLENVKTAAERLSLEIIPWNVSDSKNFLSEMKHKVQLNDAILVMPGFKMELLSKEIAQFSKEYHIPVMGLYENETEDGILASYGTSYFDQGYQSARFVSSIIQGNSPADIPVEMPDNIRFIVNQKVKSELGISLNKDIIHLAEFIHPNAEGMSQ
ncbi:ABC transporter substrate-binding protein [Cytobacillus praedii]|uniref:ABC transporter substrate-binding protein n=1 Tax=Cytobacillus praedii TaxID=1742358 RepID=UPI002E1C93CF|nr:ABC transporter substrate-binding protein [Cytobacillus praedii]